MYDMLIYEDLDVGCVIVQKIGAIESRVREVFGIIVEDWSFLAAESTQTRKEHVHSACVLLLQKKIVALHNRTK